MTDSEQGGQAMALPIIVDEELLADRQLVGFTPWGAPSAMGILGVRTADPETPVCVIAYESVVRSPLVAGVADKSFLEFFYASRLRLDYALATGQHLIHAIARGDDPPDLRILTDTGEIGLECTRFTLARRQAAHGLFRAVTSGVLRQQGALFGQLAAQVVYMWFNDDTAALALPPRRTDQAAIEGIVQALIDYTPDLDALDVEDLESFDQAPTFPIHQTSTGVSFYSTRMVGSVPESDIFQFAGFELGMAYSSTHNLGDEWQTLQSQILGKDREANDWLLISVGAPDTLGYCYQAEEIVMKEMLANQPPDLTLKYLKRVLLHFWTTGQVFEISPDFRELSPPPFARTVPANRPFAAAPDAQ